jgi:TPR repeat protein
VLATGYYADAAAEGHIGAHIQLANLFKEGTGDSKGEDAGLAKYFLDGAKNGDKRAELRIALAYEFGLGVAQSYAEAMRWHVSAAERGNVYSAYRVAEMYRLGLGVEQDARKAIPWYQKAAARGYKEAETRLKELGQPLEATKPAPAAE